MDNNNPQTQRPTRSLASSNPPPPKPMSVFAKRSASFASSSPSPYLVPVLPMPQQNSPQKEQLPTKSLHNISISQNSRDSSDSNTIHLSPRKLDYSDENLKKIILVQSVVRRWLVKRRYQVIARNFKVRCEVVKEIITSEKRYNKQLQTMIEVFLVPLRDALSAQSPRSRKESEESEESEEEEEEEDDDDEEERSDGEEEDPGYTEDDIFQIFSHLETIYNLSNVLVGLLEERYAHGWRAHRTLGDLFVQIGPFLKTLKQYVENYDNALQTLDRLKEESNKFCELIEEMEDDPRCLCLDLGSLLIVPVQRVPRYILLLATLKQNTPEKHPDYSLLTQAITELKNVATFINKGIGGEKDIGVLAYLQGLADAQGSRNVQLIQTHRKLLKHGVVSKKSLRDAEVSARELYLLTDLLVIVADISNVVSLQRIDKMIPLVTATIFENNLSHHADSAISFIVASPIKTFLFVCNDAQTKEEWMAALQTAITNLLHAHPNNIKLRQEWSVDFRHNEWQVTRVQPIQEEQNSNGKHKGIAQLAQLQKLLTLSNRGNIRIKKACIGVVQEIFGTDLQIQDKCPHYTPDGTFLVFPPSEKVMWLISMTGFITLTNKGYSMILLCAHKRGCGPDNDKHRMGKYYDLLPGEVKKFPFRGNWTIEVMGGNCAELQVVNFSPSNGDSLPNLLGMVGKVIKAIL